MRKAVRLFKDVEQAAQEGGFRLNPVAPRLFLPILESATSQDDEILHKRWVALLTNAARTDFDTEMLPCFPDILKQMTSEEALFLDKVYDEATRDVDARRAQALANNPMLGILDPTGTRGVSGELLKLLPSVLVENLEHLKLVTRIDVPLRLHDEMANYFAHANHFYISNLGLAFEVPADFQVQPSKGLSLRDCSATLVAR